MSGGTALVGLVGLGAMGRRIGSRLLGAGYRLAVYDLREAAVSHLADSGAEACASAAGVADCAQVVITSLPDGAALHTAVDGPDGLLRGSRIRVLIDTSTVGSIVSRDMSRRAKAAGVAYVDAPVSGGTRGVEEGRLVLMAAGDHAAFCDNRAMLGELASTMVWMGDAAGQAQLAKLLNNLLSATAMVVTSEAMAMGVRGGLDPRAMLEVFNAGSGRNSATAAKFPSQVLSGAFAAGFRLKLMAKDTELCLEEARLRGVPMLLGGLVQQIWTLAGKSLDGDPDHTEIARLYERWNRIELSE